MKLRLNATALAAALLLTGSAFADNTINFDPLSVQRSQARTTGGEYHIPAVTARANVAFDDDDITQIQALTFPRMRSGKGDQNEEPVTYERTYTRALRNGDKVWHAAAAGDEVGFATMVMRNGKLAGSFSAGDMAYTLNTMPDDTRVLRAIRFQDFPEEGDEHGGKAPTVGAGYAAGAEDSPNAMGAEGSPFQPIDGPATRFLRRVAEIKNQEQPQTSTDKKDIRDALKKLSEKNGRKLQPNSVVDVLVVVTNRAMCEEAGLSVGCSNTASNRGPIEQALAVTAEQMNAAMAAIDVPVEIDIVSIHHDTTGFDGDAGLSSLEAVSTTGDGQLEYVQGLKNQVGADLVSLITGAPGGSVACGIGYRPGEYSVTNYECIAGYTFIHELGHNFGCYHNPEANQYGSHPYGNGYRDTYGYFRTVMSYDCTWGCPRIPYFSNDDFSYNGRAMGDATHDNARLMTESGPGTAGNNAGGNTPPSGPGPNEAAVRVDFYYDNYPAETSWTLTQVGGGQIASVSGSTSGLVSYSYNLERGESYTLTINDSWGDGICCSYGEGRVEVILEGPPDSTLETIDGDFSSTSTTTFDVPASGGSSTGTPCEDSPSETFVVDSVVGSEDCSWLASNLGAYGHLCGFIDVALKCRVTCDICDQLRAAT